MNPNKDRLFANYKRIAAVIAETFGRNCEVVIHDFDQLPNSLVYIAGNVTRRKTGAPITDLVLRALKSGQEPLEDISNYRTLTSEGRILKSSTAFILDDQGKAIGALCINFDITDHMNALGLMEEFIQTTDSHHSPDGETFAANLGETMESLMESSIRTFGKQPATMTREEKVRLVGNLDAQGTFMIRGAVEYVAKAMGVSKYTVYNYLKEVRA